MGYRGPCILRPPEKYGLKLKVVLKWRDIYIDNIRIVLLIAALKMEGIVKWVLNRRDHCTVKPVLGNHCYERPTVLKDQIFLAGLHISM